MNIKIIHDGVFPPLTADHISKLRALFGFKVEYEKVESKPGIVNKIIITNTQLIDDFEIDGSVFTLEISLSTLSMIIAKLNTLVEIPLVRHMIKKYV